MTTGSSSVAVFALAVSFFGSSFARAGSPAFALALDSEVEPPVSGRGDGAAFGREGFCRGAGGGGDQSAVDPREIVQRFQDLGDSLLERAEAAGEVGARHFGENVLLCKDTILLFEPGCLAVERHDLGAQLVEGGAVEAGGVQAAQHAVGDEGGEVGAEHGHGPDRERENAPEGHVP